MALYRFKTNPQAPDQCALIVYDIRVMRVSPRAHSSHTKLLHCWVCVPCAWGLSRRNSISHTSTRTLQMPMAQSTIICSVSKLFTEHFIMSRLSFSDLDKSKFVRALLNATRIKFKRILSSSPCVNYKLLKWGIKCYQCKLSCSANLNVCSYLRFFVLFWVEDISSCSFPPSSHELSIFVQLKQIVQLKTENWSVWFTLSSSESVAGSHFPFFPILQCLRTRRQTFDF